MYSLVLMTAMTTGVAEAPKCIFPFFAYRHSVAVSYWGCSGCYGCGGYTSCHGCTGCYGYSYGFGYRPYYSRAIPVAMIPPTGSVPVYIGSEAVWAGAWSYSGIRPGQGPAYIPGVVDKSKMPDPMESSARIRIDVPANAKLYIDGKLMTESASEHLFYTPPLEKGQSYYYDVRIEMVKDGKVVAENKKVIVQAGAMVKESFRQGPNAPTLVSK